MLLRQMLYRTEVRLLPVISSFWVRLEKTPDYEELIRILCEKMLDPRLLQRMLTGSEGEDLTAGLHRLCGHGGALTVSAFEESFGPMRVAGTEKTLREKYWKKPVSVTEKLFYRGLIYRENRTLSGGLKECFIVPDDLADRLKDILPESIPAASLPDELLIVRPAAPSETSETAPVFSDLPDLFTLAAALKRDERPLHLPGTDPEDGCARFIGMLLDESGMFAGGSSDTEKIRRHLVQNRIAARLDLIRFWRNSSAYDEIAEDPEHFDVISSPEFDRRKPRAAILDLLQTLSPDTWWSMSGFTAAVKNFIPQFLRGSFVENSGKILDADGNDLSGIGSWFQLEGAYITFLIFGPLRWLGVTQTAWSDKDRREPSAFRISKDALFCLLESALPETSPEILAKPSLEQAVPNIASDGSVICSRKVPRYFRYMAARCCEIESLRGDICTFRLTAGSLAAAEKAGIRREAFLGLLRRFSKQVLPPSLERMLASQEKVLIPATIYSAVILTVPKQEILEKLLDTPRLEKWIRQQINQNSLMIDPKGIDEIRRFLMENEVFVDVQC